MSKRRYTSVWDAIEPDTERAANIKARATLMHELTAHVRREKLTQAQAAELLGVTQPRISNLMRGKIGLFSLDTLFNMASRIGRRVEIRINVA